MAKKELTQGVLFKMSDEEKAQALLEGRIPEKMFESPLLDFTTESMQKVLLASPMAARHLPAAIILHAFQDTENTKILTQEFMDVLPKDTRMELIKEFISLDGAEGLHSNPIVAASFMNLTDDDKLTDYDTYNSITQMARMRYTSVDGEPILSDMAFAAAAENNGDAVRAIIDLADHFGEEIPDEIRTMWELPKEAVQDVPVQPETEYDEDDLNAQLEKLFEAGPNESTGNTIGDMISNNEIWGVWNEEELGLMDPKSDPQLLNEPEGATPDDMPNDQVADDINAQMEKLCGMVPDEPETKISDEMVDDKSAISADEPEEISFADSSQYENNTMNEELGIDPNTPIPGITTPNEPDQNVIDESSHNIPKEQPGTHTEPRIVQKAIVMESPKSFLEMILDTILRIFGKKPVSKTVTRYVSVVEDVDVPNKPKRNANKETRKEDRKQEHTRMTERKPRLQADIDQADQVIPVQPISRAIEHER